MMIEFDTVGWWENGTKHAQMQNLSMSAPVLDPSSIWKSTKKLMWFGWTMSHIWILQLLLSQSIISSILMHAIEWAGDLPNADNQASLLVGRAASIMILPTSEMILKKKYSINVDNWPMSTHVHGLEVRPAFDGNPLSWFSHDAEGVGYLSLEDSYFGKLSRDEAKIVREFFSQLGYRIKINIYKNTQPVGILWYHDHSMASTGFNVRKGMSGMYLRNSTLEKGKNRPLPIRKYEQNLLIALGTYETK